jgi:hypothetical protein
MKADKIERNLLEKASREFIEVGYYLKEKSLLMSRANR